MTTWLGTTPGSGPRRPGSVTRKGTGPGALETAGTQTESGRADLAAEVSELCQQATGKGVVTRGCYDLQGLRADADYMFWWIAPSSDDLQEIYSRFRATRLGRASQPVWSAMAL